MDHGRPGQRRMKNHYVRNLRQIVVLLVVVLCLCWPNGASAAAESSKETKKQPHTTGELSSKDDVKDDECKPVGLCEMCLSSDRSTEECKQFGKRQKFECVVSGEDGKDEITAEFRSCKRTVADEEFLMVQMQVFCFLMGALAVLSVRKQKMVSLSLFDQRRIQSGKRRSSNEIGSLELSKQQEETAPLTHTSSIDVV